MEERLEFVPTVFFRIFTFVAGVYGLTLVVTLLFQPFTNAFSFFAKDLVPNLNRLGLILELVGLLSLIPDMIERRKFVILEKRMNKLSLSDLNGRNILDYLRQNFSLSGTSKTEGLIGFTSQVSRILGVLLLSFTLAIFPKNLFDLLGVPFLILVLNGYLWLLVEFINWRFNPYTDNVYQLLIKLIRATTLWVSLGIIFFLPVLFISITVVSLINWIAKNSLNKVIATITFPFILLGTLFQLIASFL